MGTLFIVPTPVGNLEDISLRAIRLFKECDLILAEDTRQTRKLLDHFGIENKRLESHHAFNEHKSIEQVVEKLKGGMQLVLVSDAGTPGISDPGFLLVRHCIEMGVRVETLPGATALIPALVSSGLPCDRFVFEGFLPHKKGRQTRIRALVAEERTIVFYESPHRIAKTLSQLSEILGPNRVACVSREISKKFETHHRGTLEELHTYFSTNEPLGEMVLCVSGAMPVKKKGKYNEEEDDQDSLNYQNSEH